MTHWAFQYVGKPWESGASGPDAYNCWGLVRHVQREHFGIETPEISVNEDDIRAIVKAFNGHDERNRWDLVDQPKHGDCVLMSQSQEPTHVGVWLDVDGGGVLHSVKGAGVIFSRGHQLSLIGYNVLGFYRCSPR